MPQPYDAIAVSSTPSGAVVRSSNGQTCTTPCEITAKRQEILAVTFIRSGCLTETTRVIPQPVARKGEPGEMSPFGHDVVYNLRPNPLNEKLNCISEGLTAATNDSSQ